MTETHDSKSWDLDSHSLTADSAENHILDIALDGIPASFDRLQEAHFWIHQLERYYHYSSYFRWHLGAFLKALNEIPRLLQMELQNEPGFTEWFSKRKYALRANPLIAFLSKQRDIVVHKKMILPDSKCFVGTTELRGLKIGLGYEMDPRDDSDHAMHRYLYTVAQHEDFLGVFIPDEDSIPCVKREWRLTGFDHEVIDLASRAWLATGQTVAETLEWMGAKPSPLALDCRHEDQAIKFKLYDRDELYEQLVELRGEIVSSADQKLIKTFEHKDRVQNLAAHLSAPFQSTWR